MSETAFTPDWASAPGETIIDLLTERALSRKEFSSKMALSPDATEDLISGKMEITRELAKKLEQVLEANFSFWLSRESQYQEDSARLWMKEIPIKDISSNGFLGNFEHIKASDLFTFFGVKNLRAWRERYELQQQAAFRTSPTYKSKIGAVSTWLRLGELTAQSISCDPFDKNRFESLLPSIRQLTFKKEPAQFMSVLRDVCARCGVAVVSIKPPKGCTASGATFFADNKAILLLSFRHLSDDQFWFSFFHEAGHIVLHERRVFLDGDETTRTKEEEEANSFAAKILVPPEYKDEMLCLPHDMRAIYRFSKKIGIAPGIVVGQLEHYGKINHKMFFRLKRHYTRD
jgi:HTH-type transcriptional regulator / antitoxin HigA